MAFRLRKFLPKNGNMTTTIRLTKRCTGIFWKKGAVRHCSVEVNADVNVMVSQYSMSATELKAVGIDPKDATQWRSHIAKQAFEKLPPHIQQLAKADY